MSKIEGNDENEYGCNTCGRLWPGSVRSFTVCQCCIDDVELGTPRRLTVGTTTVVFRREADWRDLSEENARLRTALEFVKTPLEGVWRWKGDGSDRVDGLSCPVIMEADTLREILGRLSRVDGHVRSALDLLRSLETDVSGVVRITELVAGGAELDAAIDAHLTRKEGGG